MVRDMGLRRDELPRLPRWLSAGSRLCLKWQRPGEEKVSKR